MADGYPDDPPLETSPYDPFINGDAIRYKCPGQNSRNTFIFGIVGRKQCQELRAANLVKPNSVSRNEFSCRVTPWIIPVDYFTKTQKACNSNPELAPQSVIQINYVKNTIPACKPVTPLVFDGSARLAKCNVRYQSSYNRIQGSAPAACHWQKFAPNNQMAKRLCRSIRTNSESFQYNRIRMYCGRYAPMIINGAKLCINTGLSVPIQNHVFEANLGRCKVPEILDYSTFVFEPVCRVTLFISNRPTNAGAVMPRTSVWACRIYPIFVQTFIGYKTCNIRKSFNKSILTYKIYICRIHPSGLENRPGRIFWCGNTTDAFAPALIFGRIWGGRDPVGFSTRLSGRLMGKIRP